MKSAGGVLKDTATGAAAGSAAGPYGTLAVGALGLMNGLFGSDPSGPGQGIADANRTYTNWALQNHGNRQDALNNQIAAYSPVSSLMQKWYGAGSVPSTQIDSPWKKSDAAYVASLQPSPNSGGPFGNGWTPSPGTPVASGSQDNPYNRAFGR